MRWAAFRETTPVEDMAYCLLGLFGVNIPLLYGEGVQAFIRLQEAILLKDDDQSLFAWYHDAPDDLDDSPDGHLDRLSGLLADSPQRFWGTGDMEAGMPLTMTGNPAAVTSKGLRVDLFLLPSNDVPNADFQAILSCEKKYSHGRSPSSHRRILCYINRILDPRPIFTFCTTTIKPIGWGRRPFTELQP